MGDAEPLAPHGDWCSWNVCRTVYRSAVYVCLVVYEPELAALLCAKHHVSKFGKHAGIQCQSITALRRILYSF